MKRIVVEQGSMSGSGIYAVESPVLDRYLQIGVANGRVISLTVPETPEPNAESDHEYLDRIEAYLDGEPEALGEIEVGLTVPTDQRAVLEETRKIPLGETFPLDRLVAHTPGLDPDEESDIATARTALGENPVPLLIPGHRVTGAPSALPDAVEATLRRIEGL